jgi:hypothetical protein
MSNPQKPLRAQRKPFDPNKVGSFSLGLILPLRSLSDDGTPPTI